MSESHQHSVLEEALNSAEAIMSMELRVRDASVHAPAPLLARALLDLFEQLEAERRTFWVLIARFRMANDALQRGDTDGARLVIRRTLSEHDEENPNVSNPASRPEELAHSDGLCKPTPGLAAINVPVEPDPS